DFPLYTKRKLEEIYARWNAKRAAERQQQRPAQPRPVEAAQQTESKPPPAPEVQHKPAEQKPAQYQPKKEFHKSDSRNQQQNRQPFKKKDDTPARPVDEDMLALLKEKFKKG